MANANRSLLKPAVLAVGFVAIAMSVVAVLQAWRWTQVSTQQNAESNARALAAAAFDDVFRLDVHALRLRLATVRLNGQITELYVTDAKGVVLADGRLENPRRDEKLDDLFFNELVRAPRWMSAVVDGQQKVGGPIAGADGTVLGLVFLAVSPDTSVFFRTGAEIAAAGALLLLACGSLLWLVAHKAMGETRVASPAADRGDEASESSHRERNAIAGEVGTAATQGGRPETGFPRAVLAHLLNGIGDAVVVADAAGKMTLLNDSALAVLGYNREQLIGQPVGTVFGEELGDLEELAARTAVSKVARTLTTNDGSRRRVWLSAIVVRRPDGVLDDIVCLVQPARAQGQSEAASAAGDLEAEHERLVNERLEMEAQRLAWTEAKAELEGERTRLQEQLERAERERQRYERDLQDKEAIEASAAPAEEIERLSSALQAAQDRLAKAEDERAELVARYQGSETARTEAEQRLEVAQAEVSLAEGRVGDARREAEEARKELQDLRQRVAIADAAQHDGEHARLEQERNELAESLKQAREERELVAEELERMRAYWKEQEERWQAERAAGRSEAAAATAPVQRAGSDEAGEQPVLDCDEALGGVDGDVEFLKALVDVFMESSARQMAELGAAIERGDAGSLERTARMLKGVVGTFGARAAAAAALQLETIGIVGDMDRAMQAYEKLDAEIERLKPALVQLVSTGAR
jgi:PAS domain S-box-containing protein